MIPMVQQGQWGRYINEDSGPALVFSGTVENQTMTVGLSFSLSIASMFTGGTGPFTYSVTGTLPTGLTLNTNTGLISGTPTTIGAFTGLNFQAQDSTAQTASSNTATFTVVSAIYVVTFDTSYPAGVTVTLNSAEVTTILYRSSPNSLLLDGTTGATRFTFTSQIAGAISFYHYSLTDFNCFIPDGNGTRTIFSNSGSGFTLETLTLAAPVSYVEFSGPPTSIVIDDITFGT